MDIKKFLRNLGPGLLFAGAAVGVSHLVQSTRAGAGYGFELVWVVIFVNIFKYPFFEIGHRYTAVMGESIIYGYKRLGNWAVWLFLILNIFAAIFTISAVTFVASALFNYLFFYFTGIQLVTQTIAVVYLIVVLAILYFGKYSTLESFVKYLVMSLSAFTLIALIAAMSQGMQIDPEFVPPEIWNQAGIGFLLALMGWMPAPIELSTWTSLWAMEKENEVGSRKEFKDSILDFNIGYVTCIFLAACFVLLGAYVMYGNPMEFSESGAVFAGQLVTLYTETIGDWSRGLITFIAFVTMFSTVLTCTDAYPRTLEEAMKAIKGMKSGSRKHKYYWIWIVIICTAAAIIIAFFTSKLTLFVDFVTIIAFLSSPVFALLNYLIIKKDFFPKEFRLKTWLNSLALLGLVCFFSFSLLYIWSRLFM